MGKIEDKLRAGHIDGEKLKVVAQDPKSVVIEKPTGEKQCLPAEFLRLFLLRQRGRDG